MGAEPPKRGVDVGGIRSAMAVVSHEGNDARGGAGHLQEGVLEEFLGGGPL